MNLSKFNLRSLMIWVFSIIFLLVGFLVFTAITSEQQVQDATQRILRTHQFSSLLDQHLIALDDAETGQRGYLLTGNNTFLEPYQAAIPRVHQNLEALSVLAEGDSFQASRVSKLKALSNAKLDFLAHAVELKSTQHGDEITFLNFLTQGKVVMDQIRDEQNQANNYQYGLLKKQDAVFDRNRESARFYSLLGGALISILLLVMYFAIGELSIGPVTTSIRLLKTPLITIEDQVKHQENLLYRQSSSVIQANIAIDTLNHSAAKSSDEANEVIHLTSLTKEITAQEQARSQENRRDTQALLETMNGMSHMIEALASQIERIKLIANLVIEISRDTKILAINASIESERVGDAGKSFFVIAKQIRELSIKSKSNAENAIAIIAGLDKQTTALVMNSDLVLQKVSSVAENGLQSDEAFTRLRAVSTLSKDKVQLIVSQAVEQTRALGLISTAMSNIILGAKEIVAGHNVTRVNIEKLTATIIDIKKNI